MEIIDVINKLIGPIHPVGETNEDNKRYKNLEEIIYIMEQFHTEIMDVANYKNRTEYSIKRAGELAAAYIENLSETLEEADNA